MKYILGILLGIAIASGAWYYYLTPKEIVIGLYTECVCECIEEEWCL
jgi:hypothetical protein